MNWLQKIAMSVPEALGILEFPSGASPSMSEVEQQWKRLIFKNHPDRGGDENVAKSINNAWEILKNSYTPGMDTGSNYQEYSGPAYYPPRQEGIPEWQTDERASRNEVNEQLGRRDMNYCLKEIYDFSIERGDVIDVTFMAFDGQFGRGSFTAKSNEASLGFGGEVMEEWNSTGSNAYDTVAVFASFGSEKRIKLIRRLGRDVSEEDIWLEHDSFNSNPFNDQRFVDELRNNL
ncbi:MAG: hypothetical protein ACXAC2_24780 [Candidatus Kariarchaeaceae archaeon]|jgi:curved DNA-binding protein CbpA